MLKQTIDKVDPSKKPASTPKRTIQKFMEKENPDGISSSEAFSVPAKIATSNEFSLEILDVHFSPPSIAATFMEETILVEQDFAAFGS
jgi:hypothetical protein